MKATVLGAGSYGTAIAHHLAQCDEQIEVVVLYDINQNIISHINIEEKNIGFYPDLKLSNKISATNQLDNAIDNADIVFFSTPAQKVRDVARKMRRSVRKDAYLINLSKGLEMGSMKRMSQVIKEELKGSVLEDRVMTLSGPCFAGDIIDPVRSVTLSLGGTSRPEMHKIRSLLHTDSFRVFNCKDLVGVEFGGALKNVYAIMAGMMKGSGEGESFRGEFISRALVEIDTIMRYHGADRDTSRSVAALGDLIISSDEPSRNFRFGSAYAQCEDVECAFEKVGTTTVEGYHTLKALHRFVDDANMFAPMVRELYDILYNPDSDKSARDCIRDFRRADSVRADENLRTYSKVLGSLFPRFWYRRHDMGYERIKKEFL
ncbi:hypothetical protein COV93_03965 [Candidatus Woesearchaeota archaeon CG11_big_fil_rev_8_21_14_0_20_43_8]|nr:MAG: hypothetical protein COV93_03965 [Candidatus Woesearchaeota archaeon CG11_big_fil_rev_8_21_14_0_20_43_8]PIO04749.1 MAG: hypothetical protein COT47_07685 [Candidatus Woesearchaeota archaeon CG08_land_8_20_14_0_20_43_7]